MHGTIKSLLKICRTSIKIFCYLFSNLDWVPVILRSVSGDEHEERFHYDMKEVDTGFY